MSKNPAPQPEGRPNRLARESSPYLLQHARNPVDWYPWGEEAFAEARRRGVPIFLSIGYSTCYWCHVMERESFENQAIAKQMNELFVCIKVDREERPDVDDVYMTATQIMTRSGGWPMSVFLEPGSLKPFWCGTYFPPEPRYARPGFPQLLSGISAAWKEQRADIVAQAGELAAAVKEQIGEHAAPAAIDDEEVATAAGALLRMHDRVHGGFGSAPKFPQTCYLEFLLTFRPYAGDDDTKSAVDAAMKVTLERMALGGIFDHVGGGFHRYSTDEKWLVPHFEKMLYDQGQLAEVYARAGRVMNDTFFARTARRVCEFVLRELQSESSDEGHSAFYSALDAEVNHREGQNYLWTFEQLRSILGDEDGAWMSNVFGVKHDAAAGNFRDPHHPDESASNVLALRDRPLAIATELEMTEAAFLAKLDSLSAKLLAARDRRDQPVRDEKILTAWNGLMIAGLAVTGAAQGDARCVDAAERAAKFVLAHMREIGDDGRACGLLRSAVFVIEGGVRRCVAKIPAFLDDYACFVHGLIELHRTGRDAAPGEDRRPGYYLKEAMRLVEEADQRFGDPTCGAFYDTLADQPDLFVRARSQYDGAIPSAGSIMLNNLLDLHAITGEARFAERAGRCLASVSAFVASSPVGGINSARGLLRVLAMDDATRTTAMAAIPARTGEKPAQAARSQPVAIFASVDEVTLAEGEPSGVVLKFKVDDGYHVNAAEPGLDSLIGLRVSIINGKGVAAYADYPKGEEYRPGWAADGGEVAPAIRVYRGEFSFTVLLEREGNWSGKPLLAVTYQACTDSACLAPVTVELDVVIDRK